MELTDLIDTERVALVALLAEIITADREVTDEEPSKLAEVIEAMGEDEYRHAVEEADRLCEGGVELRELLLEAVQRPEARELIYGTALEAAMANAITPAEAPILESLAAAWGFQNET